MNQLYRAYHKFKNLTHGKHSVSCIFGMPYIVKALISKFEPSQVYICWDTKPKHRLKLHPEYKGKRKLNPDFDYEDFLRQKDMVQAMFNLLGVKQCFMPDFEADDVIYNLARRFRKNNKKVIIISSDKDFNQLLNSTTSIWNVGKSTLFTEKNLKQRVGYTPKETVDYLCLNGDKSDNIAGYPGIGNVRALKILEEFGSIKGLLKSEDNFGKIDKEKLAKIYKFNRRLIDLKLVYKKYIKGKHQIKFYSGKLQSFRPKDFLRLAHKYEIKSFDRKEFIKTFRNARKK